MKLHTHLIILFLLIKFIQNNPAQQPINLTVNVCNHTTGSSATASTDTGVNFEQKNNLMSALSAYDDFKKNIPTFYNYLLQHKYKITVGLFFASFTHTQYKIHRIHKMLQAPTSWCNWKAITSTQQLASAPHDDLIPELINDIQKKYLLKSKMTSIHICMSPFDQFIKDVSRELELLEWYLTVQKITKTIHASPFFYFNHKKSFVQEKINRIHMMLDIFINWQTKEFLK